MPWPAYPIETPRLLLRPFTSDDVDDLLAYQSREDACRYTPRTPRSRDDVMEWLTAQRATTVLTDEGQALCLAVALRDGPLIGDVMLFYRSREHRTGEIGYVINPEFGGRGYATEACQALLPLAFDALGLHRVVARIDARNQASAALARRLGMRQEAHLRENEWFKGEWTDEIDFAILASEWSATHASA